MKTLEEKLMKIRSSILMIKASQLKEDQFSAFCNLVDAMVKMLETVKKEE